MDHGRQVSKPSLGGLELGDGPSPKDPEETAGEHKLEVEREGTS